MTKPKPKPIDRADPKAIFAKAFVDIGDIPAVTAWARTHKTAFYTLYSKLISQPSPAVQVNVNNTNVQIEADKTSAALEHALNRIIAARQTGDGGAVIIDARANRERVPPQIEARQADVEARQSAAADLPSPAKPDVARPIERSTERPFGTAVPGLFAAVLDGIDDNLSTTQKFMMYRGRGKMP
jgi:hypothetical protein